MKHGIKVTYVDLDAESSGVYDVDVTFRMRDPDGCTRKFVCAIIAPLLRLRGHSPKNVRDALEFEMPELFEEETS